MQVKQFQIVGRSKPTQFNHHPKIYRMKIFADNELGAKSRFWFFLSRLRRAKKANGQILAFNRLYERKPGLVKNFAVWIRYMSRSGTHNMYKEYRDTTVEGAVDQMCT